MCFMSIRDFAIQESEPKPRNGKINHFPRKYAGFMRSLCIIMNFQLHEIYRLDLDSSLLHLNQVNCA